MAEEMDLYTGKLEKLEVIAKKSMDEALEYRWTGIWEDNKEIFEPLIFLKEEKTFMYSCPPLSAGDI